MEHILEQEINQIKEVEKLTDAELKNSMVQLRKDALPGLIPTLLKRWLECQDPQLKEDLYQFFLDTKKQEELPYFMEAIDSENFIDVQSALIAVLWQSSLDASDHLEELVQIALKGDYMCIIEVGTVIENFDIEFEEEPVMDLIYQIEESANEENDAERANLLHGLRQIVSELKFI